MANTHITSINDIKNPGPWQIASGAKALFAILALVGVVTVAAGFSAGQGARVWANILTNYFFYMCLAVGAVFFVALQYVTNAMWSVPLRRAAEGLSSFLPVAAIIALLILTMGGHSLYEWTHEHVVSHDALIAAKAGYLNPKFAIIRTVVVFALWILMAKKMVGNSLAQDVTGDVGFTLRNNAWSAAFIPFFAIGFSFLCYDYMMSLEPHWFSTMFAVYGFAGLIYSTFAAIMVVTILMRRRGLLPHLNENHLHDLGKLMFAFNVFWAYIGFSQFMLIWYANLPEETVYYLRRLEGNWQWLMWGLLIFKFIVPFFVLMPREAKRNEKTLMFMSVYMLVWHWIDVYVMVMPNFATGNPVFGWIEIGMALGFLGLFVTVVALFYGRVPAMAFRDPRILEAVQHHQ